jgi:hypothetical protein
VAADVSMSAGAAREHPIVLVFGLLLSITLMGVAANWVGEAAPKAPVDCLYWSGDHFLCGL